MRISYIAQVVFDKWRKKKRKTIPGKSIVETEFKTLFIFPEILILAVILQASCGSVIYLDRLFTL